MPESAGYAEIIPLLRLPRCLGFFDYKIPDDLNKIQVGTIVRIPFRRQKVDGIVTAIKNKTVYSQKKILEISAIADPEPIISATILKTFLALAEDCFISPGLFLRSVLPTIPKRTSARLPKPAFEAEQVIHRLTIPKKHAENLAEALKKAKKHKDLFLEIDDRQMEQALFLRLGIEAIKNKTPLFLLFPRREEAEYWSAWFKKQNLSHIFTLPTDAKNKTYSDWQAFRDGKINVLVGTRQALFFPCSKSGIYVLHNEHAEEWKQSDINPRYDARRVVKKLALISGSRIIRTGPIPTLENALALRSSPSHEALGSEGGNCKTPSLILVNLKNHYRSGNHSPLSDKLVEKLKTNSSAFVFVHRKGRATSLHCSDCNHSFVCSLCAVPLSVHRSYLRCPSCTKVSDLPAVCPNCKGAELQKRGLGSEYVEEEIKKISSKTLVGTKLLLNKLSVMEPEPNFSLIAFIDPDSMRHRPDFRAEEKLAGTLAQLRALANHQAEILIQTSEPNLPIWKIAQGENKPFLETELKDRKALCYPPYWRLVKLVFQNKDETAVKSQAEKIHKQLSKIKCEILLTPPHPAIPPKIRGQHRYLIILRFKDSDFSAIKPVLQKLPDNIIIDLDAIDILH